MINHFLDGFESPSDTRSTEYVCEVRMPINKGSSIQNLQHKEAMLAMGPFFKLGFWITELQKL